jgi:NiFe hydrogenase small subunit HydA
MSVSRRDFFRYCTYAAGALGLDLAGLAKLNQALANPNAPSVIWLQGSCCTGCSVSFLNRFSTKAGEPATVDAVIANAINLIYHATIMAAAGESAAAILRRAYEEGNYILVVEGAAPLAFGGRTCIAYSYNGVEVTFQQTVQEMAAKASAVVSVGTCACFGGISAAPPNPTQAVSISSLIGRPTINISGCPANPDWVVWAIVQLLQGNNVVLDADGRPEALYKTTHTGTVAVPLIHDKCPRNPNVTSRPPVDDFGFNNECLQNLGCRGPVTKARCEAGWNGDGGHTAAYPADHPGHWCIGVNAPCHGCVEKTFPGPESFFELYGE